MKRCSHWGYLLSCSCNGKKGKTKTKFEKKRHACAVYIYHRGESLLFISFEICSVFRLNLKSHQPVVDIRNRCRGTVFAPTSTDRLRETGRETRFVRGPRVLTTRPIRPSSASHASNAEFFTREHLCARSPLSRKRWRTHRRYSRLIIHYSPVCLLSD